MALIAASMAHGHQTILGEIMGLADISTNAAANGAPARRVPSPSDCDAAIVGGGAAGFLAAITCAEQNPGARVALIEKSAHCLAKVRISGGGRCNVTHACFEPAELVLSYPRGAKALRGPYARFQPRDTMAWFESRGVALKTEADGRVFPVSDQSQTIIDCLTTAARRAGVAIHSETVIQDIRRAAPEGARGFVLTIKGGGPLRCGQLLLATGGAPQGWRWAQELGHTIEPPVPSLFTFAIPDPRLQGLAGVAVASAQLRLKGSKLEQSGPVLITHWGLSGPAVLRLSAWGARVLHDSGYCAELNVNWLPQFKDDQLRDRLSRAKTEYARRSVASQPVEELPRRLWARLVSASGIHDETRWADLSTNASNLLARELHHGAFQITSRGVFKEEFVTCGGVKLDEINLKTMESRRCPGLYFAGEIVDIDGITGGYNFQSAWTTGYLAGLAMAATAGQIE